MKNTAKIGVSIFFFLIMLVALLKLSPADAPDLGGGGVLMAGAGGAVRVPQQGPSQDKLVLGGSYLLEEGQVLDGSLFVLGGTAEIASGATVEGDAMIMGGTLTVDGTIDGDVNAIGGLVSLGSTAHVGGDVNTVSAQLNRAEGARLDGKVNSTTTGPFSVVIPGTLQLPHLDGLPSINLPRNVRAPLLNVQLNPLWDALWWLIRSFIWAALAVLVGLFVARPIDRARNAAMKTPAVSAGMGCLTILVAPVLLILFAITICGLPVSLIGGFLLWIAWVFGVIVLGTETGERLAEFLKVDWAAPVSAGAGTFVLTLVSNGIGLLIPCVGWLVSAAIGVIGLGAVLITRFGTQNYLPPTGSGPAAPMEPPLPSGPSPVEPTSQQSVDREIPADEPGSGEPES